MKRLTSVAGAMGFTSLKDNLRDEFEEVHYGYKIKVKRMTFSEGKTLADSKANDYVYFTGYIYLNPNDEIFNLTETELNDVLKLHGGITYDETERVNLNKYRVIGFDTAHYNDYMQVNTEIPDYTVKSVNNLLGKLEIWNENKALEQLRDAVNRLSIYKYEHKGDM